MRDQLALGRFFTIPIKSVAMWLQSYTKFWNKNLCSSKTNVNPKIETLNATKWPKLNSITGSTGTKLCQHKFRNLNDRIKFYCCLSCPGWPGQLAIVMPGFMDKYPGAWHFGQASMIYWPTWPRSAIVRYFRDIWVWYSDLDRIVMFRRLFVGDLSRG